MSLSLRAIFTFLFALSLAFSFVFPLIANLEASKILINNSHIEKSDPCTIVIFGAAGDLTARKLMPALYHLESAGFLSPHTAVVGFSRNPYSQTSFRGAMRHALDKFSRIKSKDEDTSNFLNKLFYIQSSFEQDQGYENLKNTLEELDKKLGTQGNRLFYLATPPSQFSIIVKKLHEHSLIYNPSVQQWSKVVVEKPFGNDLESAIHLHNILSSSFDESQVYLMDHYLGKEGVQNLFAFRFENGLFEPLWNNQYIDNIQITLSEEIGIGTRASFWEETGSLRDVVQNHLLQLIAILAMESPFPLNDKCIHDEKIRVLNAIRPIPNDEIDLYFIRGQYAAGKIKGIEVPGYKQEKDVIALSRSETFAAATLFIDNVRWKGIPFYIRAGKRLPKQLTEIAIHFKSSNTLYIRIQPQAGISIKTTAKVPMLDKKIETIQFGYQTDAYFNSHSPEAYEKLLYDCIKGNRSLYVTLEEQLIAWRLFTPVLNHWKQENQIIETYPAGTWGPTKAEEMLKRNGHQWLWQ